MKILNEPNVGVLLTSEDEDRVDKALRTMSKSIKSSPFEGKSLFQQFGKSLPTYGKGLAGWQKFLRNVKSAPETTYSRMGQRVPKLTQLAGPIGTRSTGKPSQLSQSDAPLEITPPQVEEESTFSRTGQKPVRETQVANNIPYGIPEQRVAVQKPQNKLVLPPKPRKEVPIQKIEYKIPTQQEQEVVKAKQKEKAREIASKDNMEFGFQGPFDRSNLDKWPDIGKAYELWAPQMYKRAVKLLEGNKGATQAAEDAVAEAFVEQEEYLRDLKRGYRINKKTGKQEPVVFDRPYDNISAFKHALLKRVFHRAIDISRKLTNQRKIGSEDIYNDEGEDIEIVDKVNLPPDEKIMNEEQKKQLNAVIEQLPDKYKKVLKLSMPGANTATMKKFTDQEIADQLAVPIGTVKTWKNKAKSLIADKLRQIYGNEFEESVFEPRRIPIDR